MTDKVMGGWSYTYDDLNRLTSGTATGGQDEGLLLTWQYDRYGNRWNQTASTAPGYNPPSGDVSAVQPQLSFTGNNNRIDGWSYDAAGNLLNDNINTYTYDAENRVATLDGVPTYLYDAEGRRVAKLSSSGTVTASYVLGLGGEQVSEVNGSGMWMHSNVFVGGRLMATYEGPGEPKAGYHYHLTDWLGTQRMQTTASGNPEEICYSYPFGDGLSCTGTDATEHHFTGKERDVESGNDYFGARYYSSAMGRFMSPDWSAKIAPVPYAKLGNPQSLNLYAYVYNNPLSNVDPDGHLGCGFLWLGNCATAPLAPPPAPPAPPALAIAGTPPSNLADAQKAARDNPANAPTGERNTPERKTHCNAAVCQTAQATNAPMGALLNPTNGQPNVANIDVKTLANSDDWGKVSPQTAQDLATLGVTVVGAAFEDPHGHVVTVAPEMVPGDQNVQKYGPLINNVGGRIGVTNANSIPWGTQPTYYAPTTPQW